MLKWLANIGSFTASILKRVMIPFFALIAKNGIIHQGDITENFGTSFT